jgi:hypothetical protein
MLPIVSLSMLHFDFHYTTREYCDHCKTMPVKRFRHDVRQHQAHIRAMIYVT